MIQRNASSRAIDLILAALAFLTSLAVYGRTFAPTIAFLFDDSLEFQLLAHRAAIAHPTGYPLYSLLLVIAARLAPSSDVAHPANLASVYLAALAVAVVYLVARRLPFANPISAFLAALIFAFSESFWSQALISEVYALHALVTASILWAALALASTPQLITRSRRFVVLCFLVGLSLVHHRMSALNIPAVAIYVLLVDRTILYRQNLRALVRPLAALLTPLLLFAYLPLRGLVSGSLDGTYQNTPAGFLDWVTGASYTVFLTKNPFNEQRDISFFTSLFVDELTWLGIGFAVIGLLAPVIARRGRREWVLLILGLTANLLFAVNYRVADIDVFFIPSFLYGSLFIAVGMGAVLAPLSARIREFRDAGKRKPRMWLAGLVAVAVVVCAAAIPYVLIRANWETVRLDDKYDVSDEGRASLAEALPQNATVIGILGEMTRLRYLQETWGLQPNVETVAADKEEARLNAVEAAVKRDRAVFLTRKLSGAEKKYSLSSYGSLIRVTGGGVPQTTPSAPRFALNENFDGVTLVGYGLDTARLRASPDWHLENGRQIRVTLFWRADKKITSDRLVSIKLLDANGRRAAQVDRRPVLDAYPTTAWRVGDSLADTYDVPIFAGVPAGNYDLVVTLYDPDSGTVHGERKLDAIQLDADTSHHRTSAEALGVDHEAYRDWDGRVLVGYSFDENDSFAPGDSIPLTFVWQVSDTPSKSPVDVQLLDARGAIAHAQSVRLPDLSPTRGEYVRQEFGILIPPGMPSGKYNLRLAERDCLLCLVLPDSSPLALGEIEIKR